MTGSTHPTVPQDFSIQVAQNEGMPSRQNSKAPLTPVARTRRLTGTLTLELSKTPAATGGIWSAKEQAAMRRPLARLIARTAAIAGVIASLAFPVLAQDGTGPMPENAQPRSYGSGWVCDLGYRVEGDECLALDIPEHAYPTGRSYGTGWECDRGYEEVGGTSCNPIPVPANAFLRSYGDDWQCERGFRQERDGCLSIVLPEHAYLTEDSSVTGWTCDRGYAVVAANMHADCRASERISDQRELWRCLGLRARLLQDRRPMRRYCLARKRVSRPGILWTGLELRAWIRAVERSLRRY